MQGTKYLGEIIKEEGIELGSNTLIVAPVGSGKTYYILNELAKDKKILYLCDTTNLKLQILKEANTQDYAHMLDKNVTVMTYSKFGKEIKFTNDEFINKFDIIVADDDITGRPEQVADLESFGDKELVDLAGTVVKFDV